MAGQINQKYIDYARKVFGYFSNIGCKPGEGGFYLRWLQGQHGKIGRQQMNVMMIVLQNLIDNGYLEAKDNDFFCLTQNGYDFTQGGSLVCNSLDLVRYVNLNKDVEQQFGELWDIIGPLDTAVFYVKGSDYYNCCRPFVAGLPPTYGLYLKSLGNNNPSRPEWYRTLYLSITDGLKVQFLNDLSLVIKNTYDNYSPQDDNDELEELFNAPIETVSNQTTAVTMNNVKPVKIFISHSDDDKAFVKAFVDLLLSLGINKKEQLFCSCYPPFNVKINNDIYETLRKQYEDYQLYMVYMLSENYYNSAACLNEMGAGWVLQYANQCVVLPGFDVGKIKGCVDNRKIALVADADDFSLRLNEFKENILSIMGLSGIDNALWEQKRDEFIKRVNLE